jgi:CheY-like chemotaxis protein
MNFMNRIIKILLVDDDSLDHMEVQRTLDKKGIYYRLDKANNGEEAIEFLEGNRVKAFPGLPDIILLDLNMPKMNGFEFLKKWKENELWKAIKIFVLTTTDDKHDKETAMSLGASGFITKPLKFQSLPSMDAFNLMIDMMNM